MNSTDEVPTSWIRGSALREWATCRKTHRAALREIREELQDRIDVESWVPALSRKLEACEVLLEST